MIALPSTRPNWPATIEQAVEFILARLSEEQIDAIRNTAEDDLVTLHISLGMTIRNECGLWGENNLISGILFNAGFCLFRCGSWSSG